MADAKALTRDQQLEPLSLDAAARHLLEECQMVLPGIQALFGFQLVAAGFTQRFGEVLTDGDRRLHVAAVLFVVTAAAKPLPD